MYSNLERGSGKMGCLVMLLVMAALVFLIVNIAPVYVAKINFQDDLDKITSKAGARGWSERMIKAETKKLAEDLEFSISNEDIEIVRRRRFEQAARIIITAKIRRSVSIPGFTHTFEFKCTSSGLIGSL